MVAPKPKPTAGTVGTPAGAATSAVRVMELWLVRSDATADRSRMPVLGRCGYQSAQSVAGERARRRAAATVGFVVISTGATPSRSVSVHARQRKHGAGLCVESIDGTKEAARHLFPKRFPTPTRWLAVQTK